MCLWLQIKQHKEKILSHPLSEPTLLIVESISLQFSSCLSNKHMCTFPHTHMFLSEWSEGCSVVSNSLRPHGRYSSPGQNTGVGSLSLLQGIFPTQGLNPGPPHCRQILYQLRHKGSPRKLEWVAYPFSRDLHNTEIESGSPALQADSLPTELWGKPCMFLNRHKNILFGISPNYMPSKSNASHQ